MSNNAKPTIALMIKTEAIEHIAIQDYYIQPLVDKGIDKDEIVLQQLIYNNPSKVTAKTAKAWLDRIVLPDSVKTLIVADSNYFKFITKKTKVASCYGVKVKGEYTGYEDYDVIYVPNYKSLFKQPENEQLIKIGLDTLTKSTNDKSHIIHSVHYARTFGTDRELLDELYQYPALTVDIETYGLQYNAAIATIAFAWDLHNGICIDVRECGYWNVKAFLEQYTGQLIMHNALFDAKLCIANWWMQHSTDYQGMQKGLEVFKSVDDSMLTAYLYKNSTTSISLDLKTNALPYLGQYAIEVDDISKHDPQTLMEYNIYDVLGTWYVWDLYKEQADTRIYKEIFQPSIKPLLKMMLVGLPLDRHKVVDAHDMLNAKEHVLSNIIANNVYVQEFNKIEQKQICEIANAKLVKKVKPLSDFEHIVFNPNSNAQVSRLLFDMLKLPVLDTTKSGNPSTEKDVIKDLKNHTSDTDILELLDALLDLAEATKINGTFIKAFMKEEKFLHGNLKLGGTQSGRLSSNSPNLTNLPSKGKMGKLIKSCVVAPDGWLFAGADFSSLEERIGAILSNDPNRITVYADGFDGHSMRAYKYFSDKMPDIKAKMAKVNEPGEFFKVTDDDGNVEYYHESDLPNHLRLLLK